jgi:hypothetical protein
MKRSTGKFDSTGKEVFEGDKILKWWGWFTWNGKQQQRYKIHTIVVREAHMMANGQMHDDGGGIIFCMGRTYNFWDGNEVRILSEEDIAEIGIKEDVDFFFGEDGKGIRFTDQHFMGLSDEDWEKYLQKWREREFELIWKDFPGMGSLGGEK